MNYPTEIAREARQGVLERASEVERAEEGWEQKSERGEEIKEKIREAFT